ncbi:MAG TPA: cysteine desulfurase family protein [Clostridia bacterium]|nr:cysteine desulfurase family protein [Clostridia bacterium]
MEIYLDNSATTKPSKSAIEAMNNAMEKIYGNPSSLHRKGMDAEKIVRDARESIAKFINAEPCEIVLTSGGTESNNLGIRGFLERNPRLGSNILTTSIEHPSVMNLFGFLERDYGNMLVPVDSNGFVAIEDVKRNIDSNTALVSVMAVNNEIGSIQPIMEIGKAVKESNPNTAFHVDCVQAFGKMEIDVKKMKIDLLSGSGHKFHGPKGIGFLYKRKGIKISPLFYGGNQESGFRSGTENVPAIAGMGAAVCEMMESKDTNRRKMENYKSRLIEGLKKNMTDCMILSEGAGYSPNIVNVCFKDVRAEVLLHSLENDGIFVSSGSACSSKKKGNSHVLEAIRVPKEYIGGAVRISFTWENNLEEIAFLINSLKKNVEEIRKIIKGKGR